MNIDEAIVKLNVSPLLSIKADMRAKDEDAAIATDTFLANVIDKIFETVDEMMVEPEGEQDRGAAVAASAIQALLGDLKSILKHSRDGVNLNVSYGGKTVQNQLTVVGPTFMQQIRAANLASQVAQSQEKLIAIAAALIDTPRRKERILRPRFTALTASRYSVRACKYCRSSASRPCTSSFTWTNRGIATTTRS